MDTGEFRRELLYKLIEEAEEVRQAGYDPDSNDFVKELADLSEVFQATLKEFGVSSEDVEKVREERRKERGGFDDKVFLESVG